MATRNHLTFAISELLLPSLASANLCSTNPAETQFMRTSTDGDQVVFETCKYEDAQLQLGALYRKPVAKKGTCFERGRVTFAELEAMKSDEALSSIFGNLGRVGLLGAAAGTGGSAIPLFIGNLGIVGQYVGSVSYTQTPQYRVRVVEAHMPDGSRVEFKMDPGGTVTHSPVIYHSKEYPGARVERLGGARIFLNGKVIEFNVAGELAAIYEEVPNTGSSGASLKKMPFSAAVDGRLNIHTVPKSKLLLKGITFSVAGLGMAYVGSKLGGGADTADERAQLLTALESSLRKDRLRDTYQCLRQDKNIELFAYQLSELATVYRKSKSRASASQANERSVAMASEKNPDSIDPISKQFLADYMGVSVR